MSAADQLRAALDVAALPFPPGVEAGVHPCRGKAALVTGWPDAATTDPETIRMWWRTYPAANPALALRAGLAVLDVDPRHGGAEALAALEAECGPLPATWRVATGGGGTHIYFTIPAGLPLRNRAGALGPGLDVKTAGGYVLAPGAIHPDTGRPYDWQPGHAPTDGPIAILPWPLIAKLIAPPAPAPTSTASTAQFDERSSNLNASANGGRRPIADLLDWALRQARNGNRNPTGAELARQCRDNGYTQPETEDILREYQQRAPGGDHPYTLGEALASARSAFNRPARQPWSAGGNGHHADPETFDGFGHVAEIGKSDDFTGDCGAALAETRAQLATALRTIADQRGVIWQQREDLARAEERYRLQIQAGRVLALPDPRHAVKVAKLAVLYEVASAADVAGPHARAPRRHPDHPDHALTFADGMKARSGVSAGTLRTARSELVAAGAMSEAELIVRDARGHIKETYIYAKLTGAELSESVAAAVDAAEAALADKPARQRRRAQPRCVDCGGVHFICADCGSADPFRDPENTPDPDPPTETQNLRFGESAPGPLPGIDNPNADIGNHSAQILRFGGPLGTDPQPVARSGTPAGGGEPADPPCQKCRDHDHRGIPLAHVACAEVLSAIEDAPT